MSIFIGSIPLEKADPLDKIEFIHFAIREAQNGNCCELESALVLLEDIRKPFLTQEKGSIK